MTRQDATTCAAAVAPGLEARGLPKLSRSPSQVSPLQGGGEWSRWREAALRPVSPYRHSSCQSSRVVLLRPNLSSCCWPAIIDLHDDIPLFLTIFFIFSKLNTVPSIATSQLQYHSLLANLHYYPPALPLCAQPTATLSRHPLIDVCTEDLLVVPTAFPSSVATRTWISTLSVGAISIRKHSRHSQPFTTTSQWPSNLTPRSPSPTSSQMTRTSTAESAAVSYPCVSSHWVLVALALLVSDNINPHFCP
jgi:hypothetical protein